MDRHLAGALQIVDDAQPLVWGGVFSAGTLRHAQRSLLPPLYSQALMGLPPCAPTHMRLARSGVVLTVHAAAPICMPSRWSLLTGRYPSAGTVRGGCDLRTANRHPTRNHFCARIGSLDDTRFARTRLNGSHSPSTQVMRSSAVTFNTRLLPLNDTAYSIGWMLRERARYRTGESVSRWIELTQRNHLPAAPLACCRCRFPSPPTALRCFPC